MSPDGRLIVCVRETHGEDGEPANELVALPADGDGEPRVLASGRDFYSFPRLSPDGATLAWTCWDHPNMPWDGTELWVAPLDGPGRGARWWPAGRASRSGSPSGARDGVLHFVSDRSGWWNLYREDAQLTDEQAELGYPQWGFGGSTYAFLDDGRIACIRVDGGYERLCILRPGPTPTRRTSGCPTRPWAIPELRSVGDRVIYAAKSPAEEAVVVSWSAGEGVRVLSGAGERRARARLGARAPGDRVPERRRSHRARVLVSADEPGLRGAGGRARRRSSCRATAGRPPMRSPSSTRRSPSGRAAGSAWST